LIHINCEEREDEAPNAFRNSLTRTRTNTAYGKPSNNVLFYGPRVARSGQRLLGAVSYCDYIEVCAGHTEIANKTKSGLHCRMPPGFYFNKTP
jgi:hypothetical protein